MDKETAIALLVEQIELNKTFVTGLDKTAANINEIVELVQESGFIPDSLTSTEYTLLVQQMTYYDEAIAALSKAVQVMQVRAKELQIKIKLDYIAKQQAEATTGVKSKIRKLN